MEALKTVIDSRKLEDIITLPSYFRHKKVEVTIQLTPHLENLTVENTAGADDSRFVSESFGMWKDRKDMDDVAAYVRNLRRGRKFC